MKWRAPPRTHWHGQLRGYNLGYRLVADDQERAELDALLARSDPQQIERMYTMKTVAFGAKVDASDLEEHTLNGLEKSSSYSIVISAFTEAGSGPYSQQIVAATASNGT